MSSLLFAGFDLMDPASPAIATNDTFDRGTPQPITAEQASALIDGSRIVGSRSGNRQFRFTISVGGDDRLDLANNVNTILQQVNSADPWQMAWTPDGGLTVLFDCQRGVAPIVSQPIVERGQLRQFLEVSFPALPYARSPQPVTVSMSTASQQLDSFDTLPTITTVSGSTAASIATGPGVIEGTGMLRFGSAQRSVATVGRTGLTVDPVANPVLSLRSFLSPYPTLTSPLDMKIGMAVTGTSGVVYDAPNITSSIAKNVWTTWTWDQRRAVPRTGPDAGLTVGVTETVVAYLMTVTIGGTVYPSSGGTFNPAWAKPYGGNAHFDDLRARPAGNVVLSDGSGGVYTIPQIVGTARTPGNLTLRLSSAASFSSWAVHSPPGDTPSVQPYVPLTVVGGVLQGSGAGYSGEYSVYLSTKAVSGGTAARTVTVTATQNGLPVGFPAQTANATVTYSPPASGGLLYLGEMNLPIVDVPDPRLQQVTFTVTSTVAGDTFGQLLLFDSRGQTIICRSGPNVPYVWVTEPSGSRIGATVYGDSDAAGGSAASLHPWLAPGASPLTFDPASSGNQLLVWCPVGQLVPTLTYSPRWLQEATDTGQSALVQTATTAGFGVGGFGLQPFGV